MNVVINGAKLSNQSNQIIDTKQTVIPKIAKFEKVSYEQFKEDMSKTFNLDDNTIKDIYDKIILPKRATRQSAGYDFYAPITFSLNGDNDMIIPTGIRCNINDGWVLQLYPRSGHGFKYGLHLLNTVGIIDSDYYYANNEGHIMVKLSSKSHCGIEEGQAFCQGIFMSYGITTDDNTTQTRIGGFGSTDKK